MGDIFTNLKRTFNSGNILAKLIYINVGLFAFINGLLLTLLVPVLLSVLMPGQ